jgi:TatD DNase family protein
VLADAEHANVVTVAVTELPSHFQLLQAQLPSRARLRIALGFHPLARPSSHAHELGLFRRLLERTDYVGEVGLDGSSEGKSSIARQRETFEAILAMPDIQQKVLSVHSRRAETDTVASLLAAEVTAILHWYSGPLAQLERALNGGLYFSVNGAMLKSRNGQRIIAALPRERVVTETDAPYTKAGSRPSEPRDIPHVLAGLSRVWGLTPLEARDLIFATMKALHQRAVAVRVAPDVGSEPNPNS